MIMVNIDVTTEFLNELELINYIDFDTAVSIHHSLTELKRNTLKMGDSDLLKSKLSFLEANIKIIDRVIEIIHFKPYIDIKDFRIHLN